MTVLNRVAILGVTGSIGASTVDVVRRHPGRFRITGLSGWQQSSALGLLAAEFMPEMIATAPGHAGAVRVAGGLGLASSQILEGPDALIRVAQSHNVDTVVTGIVGAAGLPPTLAAVQAGKRVLVANKEPLVMMGSLLMEEARRTGACILPTDSEHNAVFQCLPLPLQQRLTGNAPAGSTTGIGSEISRITLTASGGPFLHTPAAALANVSATQALEHPNWKMGPKVSIDSATLMNKGLELIEACALFSIPESQVDIVIHPQSIVHSLVEFCDGSLIAQLASADMRIPIAHALAYPERINSGATSLSLTAVASLQFEEPDTERFPCLRLAREAARAGGSVPTVLNAANEVAVSAFQEGKLGFMQIPQLIERVLDVLPGERVTSLEAVTHIDDKARQLAQHMLPSIVATGV
ncbi:MAG: 1-deoxy-D-xylulose-5-phosphate reductoisomerase [Proteobacteria bacterium]|nr:1-deoxy-D-xylulose-5-phosphate reductoisomerase [Pseudomonadota bacterium]